MTDDQKIKSLIVMLAEYLQVNPPLSDDQIRLYAADLADLGPDGVSMAIKRLRADPDVWAGKFPLPAKIRSYLSGDSEDRALASVLKILACGSWAQAKKELTEEEYRIMSDYGVKTIIDRQQSDTKTIFAQLRELMRAQYAGELIDESERKKRLGEIGSTHRIRYEGAE